MIKKFGLFALTALLLTGASYAQTTASSISSQEEAKSSFISQRPIFEFRDNGLYSKVVGDKKTNYRYKDSLLVSLDRSDGLHAKFLYHRNGQLDRAFYGDGTVHTALYDEKGKLYALVSTTGRALRIFGDTQLGVKAAKVSADKVSPDTYVDTVQNAGGISEGKKATSQVSTSSDIEGLATSLLLASEGWDTGPIDTVNDGCSGDPNDPQKGASPDVVSSQSTAKLAANRSDTPGTNCIIVTIPGSGGGGGGGGGGGFDLPIIIGGGDSGGSLPPGVAPGDSPARALCMEEAYLDWQAMDGFCNKLSGSEYRACNEANWRLYTSAMAACPAR
jgi:hypothetical protein